MTVSGMENSAGFGYNRSSMKFLRHRWVILLCLLLAGVAVRSFRAWQEPVVNPDTIRFIEQARALAHSPLRAVLDEPYHPLHSLAGLGVHELTQRWGGDRRAHV